jgi:hypothetical protein
MILSFLIKNKIATHAKKRIYTGEDAPPTAITSVLSAGKIFQMND